MRKIFITLLFALWVLINCFGISTYAWNSEFVELSIDIEYDTEGAYLVVDGKTPATYGQRFAVVVYEPLMESGLTADLRNAKNPAKMEPVKSPIETPIFRAIKIQADEEGVFSGRWDLNAGIDNGKYLIVRVSGAGKTPVEASKLFYYESGEHFQTVTLRKFEDLTGDELGELLVEKKLLLGITKDDSYYLTDEVETMFAAIRDNDYTADPITGNLFNEKNDIITVLSRIEALQKLPDKPIDTDVYNLIRDYGHLMEYDFSNKNNDYTLMKNNAHSIAGGIFEKYPPICLSDVERGIEQAVGLAMMNSKDSTTIAPVVKKYATILGIDANDYDTYCEKFTEYEINKAFVDQNFKFPEQVPAALRARAAVLEKGGDNTSDAGSGSSSGNSSGGGGGGGSFGGGSKNDPNRPVSGKTTEIGFVEPTQSETTEKAEYTDMDGHWASEVVAALSSKNVINGFEDGTFHPEDSVTREQFVKMIVLAFGLSGNATTDFNDVAADRWSYEAISAAVASGIVNGVGEDAFAPEKTISRQDAAVMLARLCDKENIYISGKSIPVDNDEVSEYAKESVSRLAGAGVISGFEDGTFRPKNALTRAQAAKLIYGLLNRYGG